MPLLHYILRTNLKQGYHTLVRHMQLHPGVGVRYGLLVLSFTAWQVFQLVFCISPLHENQHIQIPISNTGSCFSEFLRTFKYSVGFTILHSQSTTIIKMTSISRIVTMKPGSTHRLSAPAAFHACWTFNASTSSFTVCTLCTWRYVSFSPVVRLLN